MAYRPEIMEPINFTRKTKRREEGKRKHFTITDISSEWGKKKANQNTAEVAHLLKIRQLSIGGRCIKI